MTIQDLKQQIESGNVTDELIIFKDSEGGFISNQYINAIAKIRNTEITYIDSPLDLLNDSTSIFSTDVDDSCTNFNVIKSEVFIWGEPHIARLTKLCIVVTKFADKTLEKMFEKYIVTVPKLEQWQVKDYVYSIIEGVEHKELDNLMSLCGTNYHRLQQELDKILLFGKDEQRYLYSDMIADGAVDDLSSYNIFNITNALTSKDINSLRSVYREIERVDVNEFGLLTILVKNFRNLIMVQLNSNPTPETTGLEARQLYAIKKIPKVFSAEQLLAIYQMLLDIDRKIKMGELLTEYVIDYMIIKILSV